MDYSFTTLGALLGLVIAIILIIKKFSLHTASSSVPLSAASSAEADSAQQSAPWSAEPLP